MWVSEEALLGAGVVSQSCAIETPWARPRGSPPSAPPAPIPEPTHRGPVLRVNPPARSIQRAPTPASLHGASWQVAGGDPDPWLPPGSGQGAGMDIAQGGLLQCRLLAGKQKLWFRSLRSTASLAQATQLMNLKQIHGCV